MNDTGFHRLMLHRRTTKHPKCEVELEVDLDYWAGKAFNLPEWRGGELLY